MILQKIVKATQARLEARKKEYPIEIIKNKIFVQGQVQNFSNRKAYDFEKALSKASADSKGDIAFICEVKKASPSKGIISEEFPYLTIAKEYEKAGAAAISVLTEEDYFLGSLKYLKEISENVNIPVLRKDFVIDEYQIYEAKLFGADALLLICSLLAPDILKKHIELCNRLGLSALVEAHTEEEIQSAIGAGARIIGVNNRDLKTFKVDIQNSIRLRSLVPDDIIFVAESGIHSPDDIKALRMAGVDGVLTEALMKSKDKEKF